MLRGEVDFSIGLDFAYSGNPAAAEVFLRSAFAAHPDDLNALAGLAVCLADSNKGAEAIEIAEGFAAKHPRYVNALVLVGDVHRLLCSFGLAKTWYEAALEISGSNEEALAGLAWVLVCLGDFQGATVYGDRLDPVPNSMIAAKVRLHLVLQRQGQPAALDLVRQVQARLNDWNGSQIDGIALADLYSQAGDQVTALSLLNRDFSGRSSYEIKMRVTILMRARRWAEALDAIEIYPEKSSWHYWSQLGFIQAGLGGKELAIDAIRRAFELGIERPSMSLYAARTARALHEWKLAVAVAEQGFEKCPYSDELFQLAARGAARSFRIGKLIKLIVRKARALKIEGR